MSENSPESDNSAGSADTAAPVLPQISFWQRPFVQNVLPFASSLLLHAGLILLGFLTYKTIEQATSLVRDQIIIPDATIVEGAEVGGVPNPGLGTDPNIVSDVKVEFQEQAQSTESSSISVGAIGGDSVSDGVIGIGSGTAALRASGFGGTGEGAGFGVPGGSGGMGPRSPFMGVSGNAYRIVYICDASGGMVNIQATLRQELKTSISGLKPVQFFNIFFFEKSGFQVFSKSNLVPATPENKRLATAGDESWIDQKYQATESADPIPAFRAAFAQDPELIFILTDGFEEVTRGGVLAKRARDEIRRLNPDKKVKVNTILVRSDRSGTAIQLQEQQDEVRALTEILRTIAEENGGRFKVVSNE